jgi:hypoxanthine-DNA glycosylase
MFPKGMQVTNALTGLLPESGPNPVVLILGSFPGPRSLATGEYYANPRNQFWHIMESILNIDTTLPYRERIVRLHEARVALWDSIRTCNRLGGLDSAIRDVFLNDIRLFLDQHPDIRFIGANGLTAGRYLASALGPGISGIRVCTLPSTSPANTRYSFQEKRERWAVIQEYLR